MRLRNPFYYVARTVGAGRVPRVTAIAVVTLLILAGGISALVATNPAMDWVPARDEPKRVQVIDRAIDSDEDGLPDVLENRLGSNPENPTTLGGEVLDGWLYQWFREQIDWDDPRLLETPVLTAPIAELPEPLRTAGAINYPTLEELYRLDRNWRTAEGEHRLWWLDLDSGDLRKDVLDPLEWDNRGDGVADAWLIQYGFDPFSVDVDAPAPGDPAMNLREKYDAGLDPTVEDTAGNGLPDAAELSGVAQFAGEEVRFEPTDPLLFSTRDDGIADGYIVRFGLDPHDEAIANARPAGDEVTVREAYEVTRAHCIQAQIEGASDADGASQDQGTSDEGTRCDWSTRLQFGPFVDPTKWDSLGDGVPDAWSIRDPNGIAHPLEDATEVVVYTTEEWDANPWNPDGWDGRLETLFGVVVDEHNPELENPFELTVHDLYSYQRPGHWNEERDGPWWDGLATQIDQPRGSLPPAVALRGWTIQVDQSLGVPDDQDPDPASLTLVNVTTDPRKSDTDGDGLTDLEEYFAVTGDGHHGARTDPADPDTAGSGLTDCQEILHTDRHECEDPAFTGPFDGGTGTNPLRRDTSGSHLTDGAEWIYWNHRQQDAEEGLDPHWSPQDAHLLGPHGDIDGDGRSNILDPDSDGDGLTDGEELFPIRFLPQAAQHDRPSTDPARVDTDMDDLPDPWEVRWSPDRIYECERPLCIPPDNTLFLTGWPLDPSQPLSLTGGGVDGDDEANDCNRQDCDGDINYAGDTVSVWSQDGSRDNRDFNNRLAYSYDLNPFERFTDAADKIPDMFAIHWGIEHVPRFVQDFWELDETENGALDPDLAKLLEEQGGRLNSRIADQNRLTQENLELEQHELTRDLVVIDPAQANNLINRDTNLLELFTGRAKGVWVIEKVDEGGSQQTQFPCSATVDLSLSLPTLDDDPARAEFFPTGILPAGGLTPRVHPGDLEDAESVFDDRFTLNPLGGFCWRWIDYPLRMDIERGTNPWSHDSSGNGLPDAWEWHYGMSSSHNGAHTELPSSLSADCDTMEIHGVDPNEQCLTPTKAYQYGLDPNDPDTDGGGIPDWIEVALGLNPLDPLDDHGEEDWSGNGLPNLVELQIGLNPFLPDSAGSGLLDGGEISGIDQEVWDLLESLTGKTPAQIFPFRESTNGNGHLCLRSGGDTVPGMQNRPAIEPANVERSLNMSERFTWFVSLGLVHTADHRGTCPDDDSSAAWDEVDNRHYPFTLFYRESVRLPSEGGEGGDWIAGSQAPGLTDTNARDTSGDGVPDGWLVYWDFGNDHNGAFDPTQDTRFQANQGLRSIYDPDDDDVPTPLEYGGPNIDLEGFFDTPPPWFAPDDWDERRDGIWWGGIDPTRPWTSQAPRAWFEGLLQDDSYFDFDNDGIPDRYDPYPSIDHRNEGIIQWNESAERYDTDYTRLWAALGERRQSHLWDDDADRIPNLLDRARVAIHNPELEVDDDNGGTIKLRKGGGAATVTGQVRLDEPGTDWIDCNPGDETCIDTASGSVSSTAGGTAAVGNVTVKAFLIDVDGHEAIAGAGFTDEDGMFRFDVHIANHVQVPVCPERGATVAGNLCDDPENGIVLSSEGLRLQPGTLGLRMEIEANDPRLQPLWFNGTATGTGDAAVHAVAYKKEGFVVPDGTGQNAFGVQNGHQTRAIALNEAGTAPSDNITRARHATNATFPHSTSSGLFEGRLTLLVETDLRLTNVTDVVMLGEDIKIEGLLLDIADDVPITRPVDIIIEIARNGEVMNADKVRTKNGVFETSFPTGAEALTPGTYTVNAAVDFSLDDAQVLEEPQQEPETGVVIRRDTTWSLIEINGVAMDPGSFKYEATESLYLEAEIVDHQEPPQLVNGLEVGLEITSLVDGGTVVELTGITDKDGRVAFDMGPLPDRLPLGENRLEVTASASSGQDETARFQLLLRPVYETRIEGLSDATAEAGRSAMIEGQVVRADGVGVRDTDAEFVFESSQTTFRFNSTVVRTNATGHFQAPLEVANPTTNAWTVRFEPGHDQLHGSSAKVNTSHLTETRIEAEQVTGLRDEPVVVQGRLVRLDGTPVARQSMWVSWKDDDTMNVSAITSDRGSFIAHLPARGVGLHEIRLEFPGSPTAHPSVTTVDAAVKEPTALVLNSDNLTIHDDGTTAPHRFVTGTLTDWNGDPLGQRTIEITLDGPDGQVLQTERFTNPEGAFHLAMEHVSALSPGEWQARASYGGDTLEAPQINETHFNATHIVSLAFTRVPGQAYSDEKIVVRGHLGNTPGDFIDDVALEIHLEGRRVAETSARPGASWHAHFAMTDGALGEVPIRVSAGSLPGHVQILMDNESINRVKGVDVEIVEQSTTLEGGRMIAITAIETETGTSVSGLTLVVMRTVDGQPRETLNVTTGDDGVAHVQLGPDQTGEVSVVTVLEPTHRLTSRADAFTLSAVPVSTDTRGWGAVAAGLVAVVVVVLAATYALWRKRQRDELAAAFEQAHRFLFDPLASPRKVIEAVYGKLLRVLEEAGDEIRDEHTVRDVAARATQAFQLPKQPMDELTLLIELAKYSQSELSADDRDTAIRALRRLSDSLGTPVQVLPTKDRGTTLQEGTIS